ncbi:NAD-binding protein [candidate division KSB1 bacterium]|nr:NAD-binding protein [candidate division KSB1 bacterium]
MRTRETGNNNHIGSVSGSLSKIWRRFWPMLILLGISVVAVFLGYIGFYKYFLMKETPVSPLSILYRSLQLITLESGYVTGIMPWELQLARFLAPLALIGTILSALMINFNNQLHVFLLKFTKKHVIICGMGRNGRQLAYNFRKQNRKVVIIEEDAKLEDLEFCKELGATILHGNATDQSILLKARIDRAEHVIASCGVDEINIEISMQAFKIINDKDPKHIVNFYVHIVDLKLLNLFKSHKIFTVTIDKFEAKIFNVYEISARVLFQNHHLDRIRIAEDSPGIVNLVLFGFGKMGTHIALQTARIAHYANGKKPRITIIDKNMDEKKELFLNNYPRFEKVCDVTYYNKNIESLDILSELSDWAKDNNQCITIAICLGNDWLNFSNALKIQGKLNTFDIPILVRMANDSTLPNLFEKDNGIGRQVHAFGKTSEVSTTEILLSEKLNILAKAIHEDFVKKQLFIGASPNRPGLQPWNILHPDFKDSSLQQADHIPAKLRSIKCYTRDKKIEETDKMVVDEFTTAEIEIMAKMEHIRWVSERLIDGWTQGEYDAENRVNPHLIGWNKLTDEVKDFDRDAVREIPRLLKKTGLLIYRI